MSFNRDPCNCLSSLRFSGSMGPLIVAGRPILFRTPDTFERHDTASLCLDLIPFSEFLRADLFHQQQTETHEKYRRLARQSETMTRVTRRVERLPQPSFNLPSFNLGKVYSCHAAVPAPHCLVFSFSSSITIHGLVISPIELSIHLHILQALHYSEVVHGRYGS